MPPLTNSTSGAERKRLSAVVVASGLLKCTQNVGLTIAFPLENPPNVMTDSLPEKSGNPIGVLQAEPAEIITTETITAETVPDNIELLIILHRSFMFSITGREQCISSLQCPINQYMQDLCRWNCCHKLNQLTVFR